MIMIMMDMIGNNNNNNNNNNYYFYFTHLFVFKHMMAILINIPVFNTGLWN